MAGSRTWAIFRPRWHRHPGVRSGSALTRGERSADVLRNGMGSWPFVLGAMLFLGGWIAGNRSDGFDPYPFILLNLILSCVAALQGAILLIAAKRQDQISSELAMHDFETNVETDSIVKAIHLLTTDVHAAVCGGDLQIPARERSNASTPAGSAGAR